MLPVHFAVRRKSIGRFTFCKCSARSVGLLAGAMETIKIMPLPVVRCMFDKTGAHSSAKRLSGNKHGATEIVPSVVEIAAAMVFMCKRRPVCRPFFFLFHKGKIKTALGNSACSECSIRE